MKKIYLHRFLSMTGLFASKKEIMDVIRSGQITVDGRVAKHPMFQFPLKKDVLWKGRRLELPKDNIYIVINKPAGYLSTKLTASDRKLGKKSVFDLLKLSDSMKNTLFAAGRLDEDTSGLLVITNDGMLGSELTQPGNVKKTYRLDVEKPLSEKDIMMIQEGVTISLEENGVISKYRTLPCKLIRENSHYLLTISEGKKREVRRMFEAIGRRVMSLERIAIGKISLRLKPGEYRAVDRKFFE